MLSNFKNKRFARWYHTAHGWSPLIWTYNLITDCPLTFEHPHFSTGLTGQSNLLRAPDIGNNIRIEVPPSKRHCPSRPSIIFVTNLPWTKCYLWLEKTVGNISPYVKKTEAIGQYKNIRRYHSNKCWFALVHKWLIIGINYEYHYTHIF